MTLFNALTKALNGAQITSTEATLVGQAISVLGTPPGGAPAINLAPVPPATTGTSTTPPASSSPPKTATPPVTSRVVASGNTLTSIGASWGTSAGAVYSRNEAAIEAAAKAHGLANSNGGPNNTPGWWIFPGTTLYKP